jgi:non-heme chloroperoxidase
MQNRAPTQATIQTRDGINLYWTQWGAGQPILFVNSAGMNTRMWEYQMLAFADEGYRCISFDRRGHGLSDRPTGGYDFDTFADDLASVVETLDLKDLTMVGHSMGGGEIVRYLTRHGSGRVARIVLLAATTPRLLQAPDNPDGVPESAVDAMRAGWRVDYAKWVADNTAPFFVEETSPALRQWLANLLLECPVPVAVQCNKAVVTADFRAEMAALRVPALVLHGDRDVSAPLALTGKRSAELIPGCRLKVYEGAPHGLLYTHMAEVNADIMEFIRRA